MEVPELSAMIPELLRASKDYIDIINLILFPGKKFDDQIKEIQQKYHGGICTHVNTDQSLFVCCYDCQKEGKPCYFCTRCFNKTAHIGHTFYPDRLKYKMCQCNGRDCQYHNAEKYELDSRSKSILKFAFHDIFSNLTESIYDISDYCIWMQKLIALSPDAVHIFISEIQELDVIDILEKIIFTDKGAGFHFISLLKFAYKNEVFMKEIAPKIIRKLPEFFEYIINNTNRDNLLIILNSLQEVVGLIQPIISNCKLETIKDWQDILVKLIDLSIILIEQPCIVYKSLIKLKGIIDEFIIKLKYIDNTDQSVNLFQIKLAEALSKHEGTMQIRPDNKAIVNIYSPEDFVGFYELRGSQYYCPQVLEIYANYLKEHATVNQASFRDHKLKTSLFNWLAKLAFLNILNSGDIKASFNLIQQKSGLDNNTLCLAMLGNPITLIILYLSTQIFHEKIHFLNGPSIIVKNDIIPLFGLVQFVFIMCENKETLITYLLKRIGIYPGPKIVSDESIFLHLVTTIAIYPWSFTNNYDEANYASFIAECSCASKHENQYTSFVFDKSVLIDRNKAAKIKDLVEVNGNNLIELKVQNYGNYIPFLPWNSCNKLFNFYDKFIKKNGSKICPITLPPDPYGLHQILSLERVRTSAAFLISNSKSVNCLCNFYLQLCRQYQPKKEGEWKPPAEITRIGVLTDFDSFIRFQFDPNGSSVYSYIDRSRYVGIDLGKYLGLIGDEIEEEDGVVDEKKKAAAKSKALFAKQRALRELKQKQDKFVASNYSLMELCIEEESAKGKEDYICGVCHANNEKELFHPCYISKTILPSLFEGSSTLKRVTYIKACAHYVHKKCAMDSNEEIDLCWGFYTCPVDRTQNNAFLPDIKCNFRDFPELRASAHKIMYKFGKTSSELSPGIIESVAGIITILDYRSRRSMECLEAESNTKIIQSMMAYAWMNGRLYGCVIKDPSPLERFLVQFVLEPFPLESLVGSVKPIAAELEPQQRLAFLRRVSIFSANVKDESVDDWNERLSIQSLCKAFDVPPFEATTPQFYTKIENSFTCNIPADITLNEKEIAYKCVFTGNIIFKDDEKFTGPTVALVLNGEKAGYAAVIERDNNEFYEHVQSPIFVDNVGVSVSTSDGLPMELYNPLLELVLDCFIMGIWKFS